MGYLPLVASSPSMHASFLPFTRPPTCPYPLQTNPFVAIHGSLSIRCCTIVSAEPASDHRLDLTLDIGSAVIPHPEKVEKGGEDSFFVSDYNGGVLGVADGVSGWAEENVDPALFSRELMHHALQVLDREEVGTCPRTILAKAHEATTAIGAATAIIAVLESKDRILRIANLGDCGLRLIREGKVVFATSTQQHYFDCPYQLSSEQGAQTSNDAKVYSVDVKKGDIIIIGSDGLFDNVYDREIEHAVANSESASVPTIATALASLASKNANDSKYESPYSQEAVLQGYDLPLWKKILGQKLTGGKLDDITVLAARVTEIVRKPREITSEETD